MKNWILAISPRYGRELKKTYISGKQNRETTLIGKLSFKRICSFISAREIATDNHSQANSDKFTKTSIATSILRFISTNDFFFFETRTENNTMLEKKQRVKKSRKNRTSN